MWAMMGNQGLVKECSMGWFIFLVLVVGAVAAYRFRVPLIAKLTGQPQHRIQRAIDRRKDGRK